MEGADIAPEGMVSTDVWLGPSNIFEQDSCETHVLHHVLYMDMERLLTTVTIRPGAEEDLEIGAPPIHRPFDFTLGSA